ncbi:hypothetical protein GJ744_001410 [Endocarpon pusillum]|uniref:Uncharacterized protein n=1 Tax=Endocarpon pusillum TaxID=364733 RepID=A0A8H7ANH2_9EURO|nr:hypothetical protein GJ744_001410 [Endocarpon pusillum]
MEVFAKNPGMQWPTQDQMMESLRALLGNYHNIRSFGYDMLGWRQTCCWEPPVMIAVYWSRSAEAERSREYAGSNLLIQREMVLGGEGPQERQR